MTSTTYTDISPAIYHVAHCDETITRPKVELLDVNGVDNRPRIHFSGPLNRALSQPGDSMADFDRLSMMWSNGIAASRALREHKIEDTYPALVSSIERGLFDPHNEDRGEYHMSTPERRGYLYAAGNDAHLLLECESNRLQVRGGEDVRC